MLHVNPVTKEEFTSQEALVDSLAKTYVKTKKQMNDLVQDETDLVNLMNELVLSTKTKGTVPLPGKMHMIKLVRKLNASYPRESGEEHPLRALLSVHTKLLGHMIAIEYKESGSKVDALLKLVDAGGGSDEEKALAAAISASRITKSGKPGVQISDMKQ